MEVLECSEVVPEVITGNFSVSHQIAEKLRQALGRFPVM